MGAHSFSFPEAVRTGRVPAAYPEMRTQASQKRQDLQYFPALLSVLVIVQVPQPT